MAGSKRGEHRGNAKPGRKRKISQVDGAQKPNKIKMTKVDLIPFANRVKGQHGKRRSVLERENEMHFLITGHAELLPREAMLKAMRYFFQKAQSFLILAEDAAERKPASPKEKEELEKTIATAEAQVERYFLMGSDIAYKVAPYIHPRLSAIAVAPANAESKDLFTLLLEEIDAQGRERRMRVIEHSGGNNGETMQ